MAVVGRRGLRLGISGYEKWNTLPNFLLDQPSVEDFKSAVMNYFSVQTGSVAEWSKALV